jgi:hypothetical protein
VEIYESARKHAISDEDIRHGVEHAIVAADEDDTSKVLYHGPDRTGNLLEIVTVLRDDGTEIVILIHAMRMRRIYEPLLGEIGDPDG